MVVWIEASSWSPALCCRPAAKADMSLTAVLQALTPKAVAQQTLGKKDQVNKVVYTEEGNGKVSASADFLI